MTATKTRLAAVLVAAALAAPGCATMEVNAYVGGAPLEAPSHTYAWGATAMQPTGDPRLDNNEFFEARIRSAVERELAQRGWTKADPPDVRLHYHASVIQDLRFVGAETSTGYCTDCRPEVYDSGTLLIDVVSASDDRLLWRGWAKDNVSGLVDNQKWLDDKVDQTVARIFTRWPVGF
jgi:hypothetical protein